MTSTQGFRDSRFVVSPHREGSAVVLHVSGELDVVTVPVLATHIDIALTNPPQVLVVDLSDVVFMSSAAIKLLVEAHQITEPTATALRVAADVDAVVRPLRITGVDQTLELYPSVAEAMSGPRRRSKASRADEV